MLCLPALLVSALLALLSEAAQPLPSNQTIFLPLESAEDAAPRRHSLSELEPVPSKLIFGENKRNPLERTTLAPTADLRVRRARSFGSPASDDSDLVVHTPGGKQSLQSEPTGHESVEHGQNEWGMSNQQPDGASTQGKATLIDGTVVKQRIVLSSHTERPRQGARVKRDKFAFNSHSIDRLQSGTVSGLSSRRQVPEPGDQHGLRRLLDSKEREVVERVDLRVFPRLVPVVPTETASAWQSGDRSSKVIASETRRERALDARLPISPAASSAQQPGLGEQQRLEQTRRYQEWQQQWQRWQQWQQWQRAQQPQWQQSQWPQQQPQWQQQQTQWPQQQPQWQQLTQWPQQQAQWQQQPARPVQQPQPAQQLPSLVTPPPLTNTGRNIADNEIGVQGPSIPQSIPQGTTTLSPEIEESTLIPLHQLITTTKANTASHVKVWNGDFYDETLDEGPRRDAPPLGQQSRRGRNSTVEEVAGAKQVTRVSPIPPNPASSKRKLFSLKITRSSASITSTNRGANPNHSSA